MTAEERFRFDVQGFLVRPAALSADEVVALVEQAERIHRRPDTLPPEERVLPGGAASLIIDHPNVIDVLEEVIGPDLRLEAAFMAWRERGQGAQDFHGRGGNSRELRPAFEYRSDNDGIYAGMVRVVVELTDVEEGDGATAFLPGSHKARLDGVTFGSPADTPFADLARSYSCPAGSVIFFTEALIHSGQAWNRDDPRIAMLFLYNHLLINYTRTALPPDVLAALPREKQAYFRAPWYINFGSPPIGNTVERFLQTDEPPFTFPPLPERGVEI